MFHRTLQVLGGAVCALLVAHASPASALGWSSPLGECTVVTAYGAEYGGHTHRGVDLAGDAGDAVRAPAGGTVVFAGSVPADGGGTCNAVTIELPSGDRVSLLPLSEVWVDEGAMVGAAEQVGALAAAGDDSSSSMHVHMSLRHDGAYVDPTAFLPAMAAAPVMAPVAPAPEEPYESGDSGKPVEVPQPAETPEGASAAAGAAAVSTAAGGVEGANAASSLTSASTSGVGSLAGTPSAASSGAASAASALGALGATCGSHEVIRDIGGQSAGALAVAGAGAAHTHATAHLSSAWSSWSAWPASVAGAAPAGVAAALTAFAFAGLAASAPRMRRAMVRV